MGYLAGERMTAGRTNRLQTKPYGAVGSGTVAASQTGADIPSATLTLTTETANARYKADCTFDCLGSGAGGITTARLVVDGTAQSPLATFQPTAANQRGTISQTYQGTLPAAGSHTLKLIATTGNTTTVQGANCSIVVEIYEVV
ncbi:hypothetical protein ACIP10_15305 [Streptomyces galbus]|uniref:hypothetical protein n=1 Tax=Streptomyces galbus TaxID=33898 RepID=UPI0037ACBD91